MLAEDVNKKVTAFNVSDATALSDNAIIRIGSENMKVRSKDGNKITVFRGVDGTIVETHENGESIDIINAADDALIQQDDDFGFSTEIDFNFTDGGRTYNPSTGGRFLIMDNYDKIGESLNVETEIVPSKEVKSIEKPSGTEDTEKDYRYSRAQLYSLVEKGQEAVDGILEVAASSDHPRAW